MVGFLEGEVAESLGGESVDVGYESRVGVVLDIAAVDEVLHAEQGAAVATFELYNVRLTEVNLKNKNCIKNWQCSTTGLFTFLGTLSLLYSSPHSLESI